MIGQVGPVEQYGVQGYHSVRTSRGSVSSHTSIFQMDIKAAVQGLLFKVVVVFSMSACCSGFIQQCTDIGPAMTNAELGFYMYLGPPASYYANMSYYHNNGEETIEMKITMRQRHFLTSMNNGTFFSRFAHETGMKSPRVHWKWTGGEQNDLDPYFCNQPAVKKSKKTTILTLLPGECFAYANQCTIAQVFGCYDRHKSWERNTPDHVRQAYLDKHRVPLRNPYARDECSCVLFNTQSWTRMNTIVGKCGADEHREFPALPSKYRFAIEDHRAHTEVPVLHEPTGTPAVKPSENGASSGDKSGMLFWTTTLAMYVVSIIAN